MNGKKKAAIVAVTGLLGTLWGWTPPSPAQIGTGACKNELHKYCEGVRPGKGRLVRCLQSHQDEKGFSQDCRATLSMGKAEAKATAENLRDACASEMKAYCKKEQRGGGRILRCLSNHESDKDFSPDCRQAVDQLRSKFSAARGKMRKAPAQDAPQEDPQSPTDAPTK